ncbi:MAG: hypothetical protein WC989_06610 [Micavibrio sp.]
MAESFYNAFDLARSAKLIRRAAQEQPLGYGERYFILSGLLNEIYNCSPYVASLLGGNRGLSQKTVDAHMHRGYLFCTKAVTEQYYTGKISTSEEKAQQLDALAGLFHDMLWPLNNPAFKQKNDVREARMLAHMGLDFIDEMNRAGNSNQADFLKPGRGINPLNALFIGGRLLRSCDERHKERTGRPFSDDHLFTPLNETVYFYQRLTRSFTAPDAGDKNDPEKLALGCILLNHTSQALGRYFKAWWKKGGPVTGADEPPEICMLRALRGYLARYRFDEPSAAPEQNSTPERKEAVLYDFNSEAKRLKQTAPAPKTELVPLQP